MYNWDNYDNDIAYSYDDYIEEKENDDYEERYADREVDDRLIDNE